MFSLLYMTLRVARHTNNLDKLIEFYTKILALEILGSFKDHAGYDGVFIGKKEAQWHLEFTSNEEQAEHSFDDHDVLVFYPTSKSSFQKVKENIQAHKLSILKAKNPYWNDNGILVQDPDGFNVIISPLKIAD